MKKIAILTCLNTTALCSGASCMRAFNQRAKTFEAYAGEEVELRAFFHCNGCDADYADNRRYTEKIERVASLELDAIHVGICTMRRGGDRCEIITEMTKYFEEQNIPIVWGTH